MPVTCQKAEVDDDDETVAIVLHYENCNSMKSIIKDYIMLLINIY